MLVAAVGLPRIAEYVRLYRLRAATQQVSSQLQSARAKAVMKNVNIGAVWAARQRDSAWVIEDDLQPQVAPNWNLPSTENFTNLLANRDQSSGWIPLPQGIVFDPPANCFTPPAVVPAGAWSTWGARFGRLGSVCGLSGATSNCPTPNGVPGGMGTFVLASPTEATVCLRDERSNVRRAVTITAGGRITVAAEYR